MVMFDSNRVCSVVDDSSKQFFLRNDEPLILETRIGRNIRPVRRLFPIISRSI